MPFAALRSLWLRFVLLCACGALLTANARGDRFKSLYYSFAPPAGWNKTTKGVPTGGVAFVGPTEKNFAVNVNIYSEPAPNETLQQYVDASRKQILAKKVMDIKKESGKTMGGQPAYGWRAVMTVPNKPHLPVLFVRQVIAMHLNQAFILTLTYPNTLPQASKDKYDKAFDKVVDSFKWERDK